MKITVKFFTAFPKKAESRQYLQGLPGECKKLNVLHTQSNLVVLRKK